MEICLGSPSWPLLRVSNTKWLSLVALSGKRCSEVSHVLGGGPRQRGFCKTQLETWLWDRVLDESALTVPCPVACCYSPCALNQQHHGMSLHLQVDTLGFFSLLTSLLSLNTGAALVASYAFSAKPHHAFIVKNCLFFVFSCVVVSVEDNYLSLHSPFWFAVCVCLCIYVNICMYL